MKAKALHSYIDKNTKKKVLKGQIFEVTEKRFNEINKAGFGILIEQNSDFKVNEEEENNESNKI